MNIFILDEDPRRAAKQQCNKHVVKMILESAQMLSTAHRLLDGEPELRPSKSGKRTVKYWRLNDYRENVLYKAVHMNHPCTIWTRETEENYMWHYSHFTELCKEYTYRYGKIHKTETLLLKPLQYPPKAIPSSRLTPFAMAMPDEFKSSNIVESYRRYYQSKQERFTMAWTKCEVPPWFTNMSFV
jgi:hypothetical protein